MSKVHKLDLDQVKLLFKEFVKDEVHLGDFDQGQDLEDTMSIFDRWWKNKMTIQEDMKLVKVTDEEGRTNVYQVPNKFFDMIHDKYGDFQNFYDESIVNEKANDLYYGQKDGLCFMDCHTADIDDEVNE